MEEGPWLIGDHGSGLVRLERAGSPHRGYARHLGGSGALNDKIISPLLCIGALIGASNPNLASYRVLCTPYSVRNIMTM